MDLRAYYQKIRKLEAEILDPFVVITSRETPDGGKSGLNTDVPKALAARLIVEDRAELASPEAAAQFRTEVESQWRADLPPEPEAPVRGNPKSGKKS